MHVRVDYFFQHPHYFPWTFIGMDYPMVGMTHSYLCKFLAQFGGEQGTFLRGNPSFRELRRFANQNDGLAIKIYQYCEILYSCPDSKRDPVPREVLMFMERYEPFIKAFQAKMDNAHRLKTIQLPEECLYWKPNGRS